MDAPRAGLIIANEFGHVLTLFGAKGQKWSFPKGGEEPEDNGNLFNTAIRETQEECGLIQGRDYSVLAVPPIRLGDNTYYFATAAPQAAERIVLEEGKMTGARWLDPANPGLPDKALNNGVRLYIRRAKRAHAAWKATGAV